MKNNLWMPGLKYRFGIVEDGTEHILQPLEWRFQRNKKRKCLIFFESLANVHFPK